MFRRIPLVLFFLACSKKDDKPPPAPPPQPIAADAAVAVADAAVDAATGSGSAAAADFDFDKLSHDDKVAFMKQKVMPAMKPAFQKFDEKKFATFTCKTCHGKEPQKTKYKMPNPQLPALDFEALNAGKSKEMVAFMKDTVKPQMAKLLNQPEMTETVHEGFGCLDCHTQKKKK
jgi:cytochrome c553